MARRAVAGEAWQAMVAARWAGWRDVVRVAAVGVAAKATEATGGMERAAARVEDTEETAAMAAWRAATKGGLAAVVALRVWAGRAAGAPCWAAAMDEC